MSASVDNPASQKPALDKPSLLTPNSFYSHDDLPELWADPDVTPQLPSTTGYPLDVPPPQRLLPKIKRNRKHYPSVARGNLSEKDAMRFYKLPDDYMKPQIINERHGKAHVPKIAGAGLLDLRPVNTNPSSEPGENITDLDDDIAIVIGSDYHTFPRSEDQLGIFVPFSAHIGIPKPIAKPNGPTGSPTPPISSPTLSSLPIALPDAFRDSYDHSDEQGFNKSNSSNDLDLPAENSNQDHTNSDSSERPTSPSNFEDHFISTTYGDDSPNPQGSVAQTSTSLGSTKKPKNVTRTRKPRANKEVNLTSILSQQSRSNDQQNATHSRALSFFLSKTKDQSSKPDSSKDQNLATTPNSEPTVSLDAKTGKAYAESSDPILPHKRPSDDVATSKNHKNKPKKRKAESEQEHITTNIVLTSQGDDDAAANDDFCSTCYGDGQFLCCEGCPKSFHFSCLDPPLDSQSIPEGEWFCTECLAKRKPPMPYKRGLFGPLVYYLDTHNSVQFSLPKKIRQKFRGPTSNELYYSDSDSKTSTSPRSSFGEYSATKMKNKQGKSTSCHGCKKSTVTGGPVVRCEYCPINFHLSCLDTPLTTGKAVTTKWKCPNYANKDHKKKRRSKSTKPVDISLLRELQNDAILESVMSSDEEYPEYRAPLFNYSDSSTGVSATVPQSLLKPLTQSGVVYRIPEEGVKLDFIQRVHEANDEPYQDTKTSDILLALNQLAIEDQDGRRDGSNLYDLKTLGFRSETDKVTRNNIEVLIDVALGLSKGDSDTSIMDKSGTREGSGDAKEQEQPLKTDESVQQRFARRASQIAANRIHANAEEGRYNVRRSSLKKHTSPLSSEGAVSTSNSMSTRLRSGTNVFLSSSTNGNTFDYNIDADYISPEEKAHLVAIRKLLKLKGEDALMDFLLPRVS